MSMSRTDGEVKSQPDTNNYQQVADVTSSGHPDTQCNYEKLPSAYSPPNHSMAPSEKFKHVRSINELLLGRLAVSCLYLC